MTNTKKCAKRTIQYLSFHFSNLSHMSSTTTRIITDIVLLLCVLFTPWWVTLLLATIAAFSYPTFIEIIIIGVLLDLLFGAPGVSIVSFPIIHTLIAFAIYGVSVFIRARVR